MNKTERLDPYWDLLRIPPEEQPPDYYRLLGVNRFEEDAEVIKEHVNWRTRWITMHKKGSNAKACNDLVYQINAAKTCLLTPRLKAAYDGKLRSELAGRQTPDPRSRPRTEQPVAQTSADAQEDMPIDPPAVKGTGPAVEDLGSPDGTRRAGDAESPPPHDGTPSLGEPQSLPSGTTVGPTNDTYDVTDPDEFDFLEKVDEPKEQQAPQAQPPRSASKGLGNGSGQPAATRGAERQPQSAGAATTPNRRGKAAKASPCRLPSIGWSRLDRCPRRKRPSRSPRHKSGGKLRTQTRLQRRASRHRATSVT